MPPLICTSNSFFHTDFGIPIIANKSTDYRTTTGTYHGFIPSAPQEFDCRVKARIKPGLQDKDVALRDESYKTVYSDAYFFKLSSETPMEKCFKAKKAQEISYTRNVQEKLFADPPPPRQAKLSEMKDEYRMRFFVPNRREVYPPEMTETCEIQGLCRDEQPPVRPEKKGYYKHLDPYLTTNRATYVPYSQDEVIGAQEDLVTFYNISGKHKGSSVTLPGGTGNKTVFDRCIFKEVLPNRLLTKSWKRVPHSGLESEYNGKYLPHTFSQFYPYIFDTPAVFCETLGVGGPWQNLCPPAMYCSEYSHIAQGTSVSSAVDVGQEKKHTPHEPCDKKV